MDLCEHPSASAGQQIPRCARDDNLLARTFEPNPNIIPVRRTAGPSAPAEAVGRDDNSEGAAIRPTSFAVIRASIVN